MIQIVKDQSLQPVFDLYSETEELLQFGSWTWEPQSGKVQWSSGVYNILDYKVNEVTPSIEVLVNHVLPEYHEDLLKALDEAMTHQQGFELEFQVRTNHDAVKVLNCKTKPAVRPGMSGKFVGIIRDITSWKNAEREQERTLKELNRSNKELEEFAYVASHDLQEPLRKIAMFSERLKTKYGNNIEKDGQHFMDRILASADNMRVLIENLLEFSKANRGSHNYEKVDLKDVINQVTSNLELKIEETRAQILVTSTLPVFEAVYSEMQQLFGNLISNAIKFAKPGVTPVITINAHKATKVEKMHYHLHTDDCYFVIDVKDNGIGFEQEYSEKIFQIFHRLHGKSEYAGSGIGLAICKRIVDNHNGRVMATSAPFQGATFTIVLPQKQF